MVRMVWGVSLVAAILQGCSGPEFVLETTITDHDGDGYDNVVLDGDDCNDSDPEINPGADEICDGIDNN